MGRPTVSMAFSPACGPIWLDFVKSDRLRMSSRSNHHIVGDSATQPLPPFRLFEDVRALFVGGVRNPVC